MALDLKQATSAAFHVHLQQFDGPLDLLLHLIREQEVDIYDIPVAQITDQYLGYLRRMEELDLNIAGDFLVMAATLIEIKSKLLLPKPPPPEVEEGPDPRDELVQRLLEYEKYKEVAGLLRDNEEMSRLVFTRCVEVDPDELPPVPSGSVSPLDLLAALKRVLEEVGEGKQPITSIPRQKITLRMKMSEMFRRVRESGGRMPFSSLFAPERTRTEVVVAFLALLELLRLRKIEADQGSSFGEIYISEAAQDEQAGSSDSGQGTGEADANRRELNPAPAEALLTEAL